MDPKKSSLPSRNRNRASVACTSCRASRTKCFVSGGHNDCDLCRRNGVECIFRDDDGRKRQGRKSYTNSLLKRIEALENMLKQSDGSSNTSTQIPSVEPETVKLNQEPENGGPVFEAIKDNSVSIICNSSIEGENSPERIQSTVGDAYAISKLLSPANFQIIDGNSGRVRYFGMTANMHILANQGLQHQQEVRDSQWRIEMLLPELSLETLDYLMSLYWNYHNSIIHLVHKVAFHEDRMSGKAQFYSTFLHFCMLSIGFRYADKSRPDIKCLMLPHHESTLHKKTLKMVECELFRPGGIPSVQALFLLGDLECGCGRDDTGWMYGGMSSRLALDLGLHVKSSSLSERHLGIRYMIIWACIINDKYWSLFLGRPTNIRSDRLCPGQKKTFDRLIASRSATIAKTLETKSYEAMLGLMDIAGTITDIFDGDCPLRDDSYFQVAAVDKKLQTWHSELPPKLMWTSKNISKAPLGFFLLHQQYHTACILLHRPFAAYEDQHKQGIDCLQGRLESSSLLSRQVCLYHATRIASIFAEHRQRFDSRRIFVTAIQHAGTAAMTLVNEITATQDLEIQKNHFKHLKCLHDTLLDMAETYEPAERMSNILARFFKEMGAAVEDSAIAHPVSRPLIAANYSIPEFNPRKRSVCAAETPSRPIPNISNEGMGFNDSTPSMHSPRKKMKSHSPRGDEMQEAFWGGLNSDMFSYMGEHDFGEFLDQADSGEVRAEDFGFMRDVETG